MSGQCSLCLSCGAPFLPIGEDMVVYDRVGNISVFYFQKLVKNNDVVQKTVVRPNFCAKADASHILHQAHHKHAVEYTIEKRLRVMERADQLFPFMRTPGGKNKHPFLAQWAAPTPAECVDHQALARFIDGLPTDGHQAPDYAQTVMCCKDCNMAMTMKFWFQYHLCAGSQVNATCIIPDGVVQVFRVNRHGHANSLDTSVHWTVTGLENNYPLPAYQRNHDVLTAMLGYYLALCEPHTTPGLLTAAKFEHRALYTHMCWVVLEVTCLLCEYWRGSRDAEQHRSGKKRYRCLKTPLGAVELYFSYFCWRILGFRYPQMRGMSFPTWHQIYMWYAGGCEQLFPRKEGEPWNRLIADRIAPDDMYMGSRELVREVGINMTRVLRRHIMKLGAHVCGVAGRVELRPYFLHRQYIQDLHLLMMRGAEPDFDSFAAQVGIDAMMTRVIQLCRDFPNDILRQLSSFRTAWRRAEVQNVARATGKGDGAFQASNVLYRLCKLLRPPTLDEWAGMTAVDARLTLLGPRCCPWAAVLALERIGAFDTTAPEPLQLTD